MAEVFKVSPTATGAYLASTHLFSVAGGLPCGKEGPMIHSGAIVGAACTAFDAASALCDLCAEVYLSSVLPR